LKQETRNKAIYNPVYVQFPQREAKGAGRLCGGCDNLVEPSGHCLGDFFILVRKEGEGVRDVVPLPLSLAPW
jgi:hypothetical protein